MLDFGRLSMIIQNGMLSLGEIFFIGSWTIFDEV